MKIKFKNTPEQIELIKATGSRDIAKAREALEILAALLGPVVAQVLNTVGTASLIYNTIEFDEDDVPSFPLDLLYNQKPGYISTWSQTQAGGLPSSTVEGGQEMKFATYRLDSAVSWMKKYARKSRWDVIAKNVERMGQEILIKQELNAWVVILKALSEAQSPDAAGTALIRHLLTSPVVAGTFLPADLSALITRMRRVNSAFQQGTPSLEEARGCTDLFVSPEVKEYIRNWAFNPTNVKGAGNVAVTSSDARANGVALPDAMREQIYRSAGLTEVYGVTIHEALELGAKARYQTLFNDFAVAQSISFTATSSDLLVGFDLSRDAFIRPVARQADGGGTFTTQPDDQWVTRSDKAGLFGFLEEGRVCVDSRGVCGLII